MASQSWLDHAASAKSPDPIRLPQSTDSNPSDCRRVEGTGGVYPPNAMIAVPPIGLGYRLRLRETWTG